MTTTIKERFYSEQKIELLQWFEAIKLDFYRQLMVRFSKENIKDILARAKKEFDEMIPELPYVGGNENPYTRLVILAGMSVAFYLALIAVLKSKTLARSITYTVFKKYMLVNSKIPNGFFSAWMFFKILQQRTQ